MFDGRAVNAETASEVRRGRLYAQCLLTELELGNFEEWVDSIATEDEVALRVAVNTVWRRLHKKVSDGGDWTLPPGSFGGTERTVKEGHPKLIEMAIHRAIDATRRNLPTGPKLGRAWKSTFSAYTDTVELLKKSGADKARATGTEASQRRDRELQDHEQLALFGSILSNAVAVDQESRGVKRDGCRKPMDTLTVGVIVALHFPLGQRCLNVRHLPSPSPVPRSLTHAATTHVSQLDDLKWGNIEVSRFTFHQVWENVLPFRLLLRTAAKGDVVGARKHLAGIMHNRDPMRNAMAMLGLYFAFQFLVCSDVSARPTPSPVVTV